MGGDTTVVRARVFPSFERLPEGPKCGDHLFVRNVSVVQVVGEPTDKKEKYVSADFDCGSELADHVGARRSAKIVFDLVQIGPGNRVTILESDPCGELPLREPERFALLSDEFAESPHFGHGPLI